jgi:hypothetical protein
MRPLGIRFPAVRNAIGHRWPYARQYPLHGVGVVPRQNLTLPGAAAIGSRDRVHALPDFFIGAQAAVLGLSILTGDAGRYRSYFPTITHITPAT